LGQLTYFPSPQTAEAYAFHIARFCMVFAVRLPAVLGIGRESAQDAEFYPAGSKEAIFQKQPSSFFVSENDKMELVVSQNEYRFTSKINVGEFKNYAISSTGSLRGIYELYERIIQEYNIAGVFFKDKQVTYETQLADVELWMQRHFLRA